MSERIVMGTVCFQGQDFSLIFEEMTLILIPAYKRDLWILVLVAANVDFDFEFAYLGKNVF